MLFRTMLTLFANQTKNRFIIVFILLYSVFFVMYVGYSGKDYLESIGNIHMNRSRVANTQAMTLNRTRLDNPMGYNKEELDMRISFYSDVSKSELTVGKMILRMDDKNNSFINHTLNSIYNLYLKALDEASIDESSLYKIGLTLDELIALEGYTSYLDKNVEVVILNPYELNSANLSVMFLKGPNLIMLTILIISLTFDAFLSNMKDGSYKTLYTLKYSRKHILFTKYLIAILLGGVSVIVTFVVVNVIGYTIGGLGDWSYPMMSKSNGFLSILPVYQIVIRSSLLYFILLVSLVTFTIYISIISNSSSLSISISFGLLFILIILFSTQTLNSKLGIYFPYSYLIVDYVWSIKSTLNIWYGITMNFCIIFFSILSMKKSISSMDLI